jgi:hypothetical protein
MTIGIVSMLKSVEELTMLTEISMSRLYLAANIEIIAATGEDAAVIIASIIVLSSMFLKGSMSAIRSRGKKNSLIEIDSQAAGVLRTEEKFALAK